jgi:glycosyltransferase involved in cell wall biosynthesis
MVSRAIQSVLSQSFRDFELIVVDDHSTVYSEGAFSEFRDPRLTVVRNVGLKGACGARNTGLALAKGEWLAFLDDDDEWMPEKLAVEKTYLSQSAVDEEVVLIYSDAITRAGNRERLSTKNPVTYFPDTKRNLLYKNSVGGMSSATARLRAARAVEGFDETLPGMQDLDFFVRLCSKGSFRHIDKALTIRYVDHNGRITRDAAKKLVAAQIVRQKYREDIEASFRLRYIYGSRYYRLHIVLGNWERALKLSPWFIAGIALDRGEFRKNAAVTFRTLTAQWTGFE